MAGLDSHIDELYKAPLDEFIAARDRLAKTLKAANPDDAKRVKALAKPVVVPWAVNQLYWRARPVFDRLAKSGEKLRTAQIAALKGKSADVQSATAAHRKAMTDAVAEATRLAAKGDAHPAADALARMLEVISLSEKTVEPPGRFTKPLQPAGFEALAGIAIAAPVRVEPPPKSETPRSAKAVDKSAEAKAERDREDRERVEADKRRQTAIRKAELELRLATEEEERSRAAWERAKRRAADAQRALSDARDGD